MKNKYKIISGVIIFIFVLSFATMVYADAATLNSATAQTQAQTDTLAKNYCSTTAGHSDPKSYWPLIQCGGSGQPCCDFNEAAILVNRILNWFLDIAATVAAITFAIAGANILLHPDDPAKITEGWDMFKKTAIGLFIVLIAWLAIHTAVGAIINPAINSNSSTGVFRFFQ